MEKERENIASGSPGINPVKLNDCIEQLLEFILQAFINGTLDFDLGLSTNFCATLLNPNHDHDVHQFQSESPSISSGLPLYPLYKSLASALHQCIMSGSFVSVFETVSPMSEDDSLKELKEKWNELISVKGFELVNLLNSIRFELHVQEPYFTQLKDGLKTVEGRCAVGNYNRIGWGDLIFFNKCLMLEVQDVRRHASFYKMLEAESLEKVLPGVLTIEEGEQIYRNFYSKEKEQSNGVLAICVGKPASQPYSLLSDIIAGLGYKGIQSLLGLKHTIGTTPEALPPPRSTLLSSFMLPQNPNVAH
ncbi:uncharacterized protein LOC141656870 isoform X2 [Silene latifolia]|uniref:uncharacterized protein LOC141656870 isoform X2 n=1 Tax=Silene latifolia TaxID=37657 RepID=UPI003D7754F7